MSLKDNLAKLPEKTLSEAQRQAEIYLAAQLQSGIAADARAISFVSLMAAATVALGGGGVALLIADHPSLRLGVMALLMAFGFVISMSFAIVSARPADFEYGGGRPEDWEPDALAGTAFEASLAEQLEHYNERSGRNVETLRRNAWWMQIALRTALGSIAVGAVATAVLLYFGRH